MTAITVNVNSSCYNIKNTPPDIEDVEYTVTYHGNGYTNGAVPIDSGSPYVEGSLVVVLGQGTMVRNGYVFLGWSTISSATTATYVQGNTFTILTDTTLYATWTQQTTPTPTTSPSPSSSATPTSTASPTSTPISTVAPTPTATLAPISTLTLSPTPTLLPVEPDEPVVGVWALVNLVLSVVGLILIIVLVLYVLLQQRQNQKKESDDMQKTVNNQQNVAKQSYQQDDHEEQQKKHRKLWLITALIMAVVSVIVFLLTEDMGRPMLMMDKWTIVNVVLFIIELVAIFFALKSKKEKHC